MAKKLILLLCASLVAFPVLAADREHTLKIYNWSDYIDPKCLDDFQTWYAQQTGETIDIVCKSFDINENMLAEIKVEKEDYDVVCPSEYIIERMLKQDLLLPIEKSIIPDSIRYFDLVAPFVANKFQEIAPSPDIHVADYAIGYMWGTTGILYNAKYVQPEEVSSWSVLTNVERFKRRILLKDAFRDIYSVVILYAFREEIANGTISRSELVKNVTPELLAQVEDILMAGRDCYAGWEIDFRQKEMMRGDIWIDVMWSGDALWAMNKSKGLDMDLRYTVPQEGTNVWFDGWCIPRYAVNTKAATYFINFLCRPDIAIRNMEETGFVSVIASDEILNWATHDSIEQTADVSYFFGPNATALRVNQVQYPDQAVIDRCALMHDTGSHIESITRMWNRVKGDRFNDLMLWVVVIVVSAILLLVVVYLAKFSAKRYTRR